QLTAGRGAPIMLVRYATDSVSIFMLDTLDQVSPDDFVRAVSSRFDPPAFAMALVRPVTRNGSMTMVGVHCRAMFGNSVVEVSATLEGDADSPTGKSLSNWKRTHGRAMDDR